MDHIFSCDCRRADVHAACRSEQLAIDMQIARERAAAVENLRDQVQREGERRCSQLEVNMRLVLSSK